MEEGEKEGNTLKEREKKEKGKNEKRKLVLGNWISSSPQKST
jgi:hypothetical protein